MTGAMAAWPTILPVELSRTYHPFAGYSLTLTCLARAGGRTGHWTSMTWTFIHLGKC